MSYEQIARQYTKESVSDQSKTVYEDYHKVKKFEDVGHFLTDYVVDGGEAVKDTFRNDTINVSAIVASINDNILSRDGHSFTTNIPNAIYYLDFTKDGDWHWGTSHTGVAAEDYIPVSVVTTNSSGLVNSINDARGYVGGFRLKDEYGLEGYAKQEYVEHQLAERAKYIDEFPIQIPETDDTGRFQRAVNSGYNILLQYGGEYTVDTVRFMTSGVTVLGNKSIIHAKTTNTQCFLIGRDENENFVKVKDITIEDINFVGVQNSYETPDTSSGINIKETRDGIIKRNHACENIVIRNCRFSKFTFGIIANGVTGLFVEKCVSGNHYFNRPNGAGGYGVLIQCCFDVYIEYNTFIGKEGDRHALYLSNIPNSVIPNENVNVYRNTIDFTDVVDITGFESCLVARSNDVLNIKDNIFRKGFGGVRLLPSNGNTTNVEISGNQILDSRKSSKVSAMDSLSVISDPTYTVSNLRIHDNDILSLDPDTYAVSVGKGTDVKIYNNTIQAFKRGVTLDSIIRGEINNNTFLNCAIGGIFYGANVSNVDIGKNIYNITGARETASVAVSNITHNFERRAIIRVGGGNLSKTSDPWGFITSMEESIYGVKIFFARHTPIDFGMLSVVFQSSTPYIAYNREINSGENSMILGVTNAVDGSLVNLKTLAAQMNVFLVVNS